MTDEIKVTRVRARSLVTIRIHRVSMAALHTAFLEHEGQRIPMPRSIKHSDRPSKAQIKTAIEWLRKNDLGDADTVACEKVANFLETKVRESAARMNMREMNEMGKSTFSDPQKIVDETPMETNLQT